MSNGHRSKRNERIQLVLDDLVKCRKKGTLKSEKIMRILLRFDPRWGLDNRQVSSILRQREDLKKSSVNEWQIVEACS